jgi:hypothetical protein
MSVKSRIQKLETKEGGDAEILVAWEKGGKYYTSSEYSELIPAERIQALEKSPSSYLVAITYKDEGEA